MKSPIKLRVVGFLATVVLGGILIAWTERHAWRQTNELQKRFEAMQRGGFHLADYLEASILRLNYTLFRFDLREDPGERIRFQKDSEALKVWMAEHRTSSDSADERELLLQIEAAFADYLTNALQILQESAQTVGPGSPAALFERTAKESDRLLTLGGQLANAQRASLQVALANSHQALAELKFVLAVSLVLLIVLSLSLSVIVYRGMIAPLRINLIESRALIERQEKLASLGVLAAGVAHEIRNPLTAIKARLFTQRKLLPENYEALEDNRFISDEIFRLDDIIKDFLLFARPSEPRFKTIRATTPFRALTELLGPELQKNAIALKPDFLADPQVKADPQQIKQVLINLIKNAADSIGQNGTITLRTRTQIGSRSAHVAVLDVEDTGKGIPPEVQKRLFDPFFTTKETGAGLGLSIAARILEKTAVRWNIKRKSDTARFSALSCPLCKVMTAISAKILLIEDDARAAVSLEKLLKSEGYAVTVSHRGDEGFARAQSENYDVVITDLRLPGIDGLELMRALHAAKPRLPIVLMTAFGTTETVIEATKRGAFEYLIKPFEMEDLLEVAAKAVASARLMSEPVDLGEAGSAGEAIVGNSRVMQEVYKEIGRVAAKSVAVLIRGETGTGKELVARAIYQHSARADKTFIAVNCAAIPETLLESELFGHERGAFTGAESRRIGRFEQADGGTLFLDEIGDMSAFTQAKLLRVLQEKCIQRVGGKETIPVDVRIIAATHRDLERAIREKQFREDLFYRLSSFVIHLPPLRDRLEDIPDLVKYFLQRLARELELSSAAIHPDATAWLQQQSWPGSVRQLANVIRQALLLARDFPISVDNLKTLMLKRTEAVAASDRTLAALVDEFLDAARQGTLPDAHAAVIEAVERELFTRAIELAQGNQAKAARWLNVSRQTMREKLTHFGLRTPSATKDGRDFE